VDSLLQDLRYAARRLRGGRAFTIAVVLTMALGIGATIATFAVVDAVALRPLPFPDADRLVRVRDVTPQGEPFSLSEPDFLEYARGFRTLSHLAAVKPLQLTLTDAGDPVRLDAAAVSATFFSALGIAPAMGRGFEAADDRDGQPSAVAILSHAIWQQRFGGDPGLVGRAVRFDGKAYTVIGVLPASAAFPAADVLIPLGASMRSDRTDRWLDAVGRLAPGASLGDARAEAVAIAAGLAREYPEMQRWSAQVVPLADWLVGPGLRRVVWVLLGAVGMLLVLASANIAGLLMARAAGRRGEMGVRAALGADQGRLVRQLLTESLLLGVIGGAVGLAAAFWMLDALSPLLAGVLPLGRSARIDARVVGFAVAMTLASTIAFGLAPALHTARADLQAGLRPSGRGATPASRRWISLLVGVQVALAMLLLVGSLLLLGSFARLSHVDPGFDASNVLTVPLLLPERNYVESARAAFFDSAVARIASVPGVESAAATATNPFRQWGFANDVTPEDRAADAPASGFTQAGWRSVTPGFFATLRVPLIRGRAFSSADREGAPGVVIVSQSLAVRLWPGAEAVGRRVYWGGLGGRTRTVVGVVGDIRDVQLDAAPTPMMYLPYGQLPLSAMTLLVRTHAAAAGVAERVRQQIRSLDSALPVPDISTLETNRAAAIAGPRFRTILLALFGSVALLLASVGLYALVAFTVAQRTREIAIRVAVGARPSQVAGIFVGRGVRLTAVGGASGLLAAWALSGVLRALLFETDVRDAGLFALAAALLALVALAASFLPARRAARLDPVVALSREQV
jgi:putative ABC transport system permease protein